jgi:hypothetical protein
MNTVEVRHFHLFAGLGGGARGFICTRGPRPRCACGKPATLQCDGPSRRKSGTCDKHLCAGCAAEVGTDRHLCAGCVQRQEHEPTPMEPWQAGLF